MKTNTLISLAGCIASVTGVIMAEPLDVRLPHVGWLQTQSGGGTPAKAPGPKNPTPSPQPPAQTQPAATPPTPAERDPKDPANPNPTGKRPGDPATPLERRSNPDQPTPLERKNPRFFRFADDKMEAKFNESGQRLVAIEQRMAENNKALLTRLGDVRSLAPERQNAALADLLQEILRDQAQLQQYLVMQRTLVTGDFASVMTSEEGAAMTEQDAKAKKGEARVDEPGIAEKRAGTPGAANPR